MGGGGFLGESLGLVDHVLSLTGHSIGHASATCPPPAATRPR